MCSFGLVTILSKVGMLRIVLVHALCQTIYFSQRSAVTKVDVMMAKMACRVVRTLSTYSKSNTLAEAGAIERQLVLRLFVNFCHKNGDIFFDSRAIAMKVVVHRE